MTNIRIRNLYVKIEQKKIRNIRIIIIPPDGKVRVIAPNHLSKSAIKSYLISKLSWIDKNVKKFSNQKREMPYKFIDREDHYILGKNCKVCIFTNFHSPLDILFKGTECSIYSIAL